MLGNFRTGEADEYVTTYVNRGGSWSHARVLCVGTYARDDGEFAFGRRVWKGIEREDSLVILLQGTVGAKGE